MKYLVTGGAGFIGSNIVEELLKRDEKVVVLDNYSTGKRENLTFADGKIDLIYGDIRDPQTARKSMQGVDVILHQAALPSVPRSIVDPVSTNEVNVVGTLNILEAARNAGVKRVVIASSSSVYGDTPELPKHEHMQLNPLSPYAVSKMSAEKYCSVFSKVYGMQTVALRYFNVFGPRQDPTSQYSAVIPRFIRAIMNNEQPLVYGDGEQSRDFTYVSNVVEANLLAATSEIPPGIAMNCACHERTTINSLISELNKILGKNVAPIYQTPRPGDIKHSFASIDLAFATMGYVPRIDFRQGLRKTVESFL